MSNPNFLATWVLLANNGGMNMFFFNKEEIYIGYSMGELSKVRGILESKGIKYTYKVINRSSQWLGQSTTRGNFGSDGMNSNYETQLSFLLRKKTQRVQNIGLILYYTHRRMYLVKLNGCIVQ